MVIAEMSNATRGPTPEEMRRIEDEGGVEFVDGQLVEKNGTMRTSSTSAEVGYLLWTAAEKAGGVEIYSCGLAYNCFPGRPHLYRKPSVSIMRVERLREAGIFGDLPTMPIVPDLAVEVVRPYDNALEVQRKIDDFLTAGFPQVWVVWLNTRTVEVLKADGSGRRLAADDEITVGEALPAFRCKVSAFFE